jgi:hypothetical protein
LFKTNGGEALFPKWGFSRNAGESAELNAQLIVNQFCCFSIKFVDLN